jgi:hypothetical protein
VGGVGGAAAQPGLAVLLKRNSGRIAAVPVWDKFQIGTRGPAIYCRFGGEHGVSPTFFQKSHKIRDLFLQERKRSGTGVDKLLKISEGILTQNAQRRERRGGWRLGRRSGVERSRGMIAQKNYKGKAHYSNSTGEREIRK